MTRDPAQKPWSAELLEAPPALQDAVNPDPGRLTAAGGASRVDTGGDESLTARRAWIAELPPGRAEIPCGGTHVTDIADAGPHHDDLSPSTAVLGRPRPSPGEPTAIADLGGLRYTVCGGTHPQSGGRTTGRG